MHLQVLLGALLLVGVSTSAASPAEPKEDTTQSRVQLRAYLPTIRLKAMYQSEHDYAAELERSLKLYERFVAGGRANTIQRNHIEEELLRGLIRVRRRDNDYRDSRDQFTSQFKVTTERRQQMEDATISPLANLFRRFWELSYDSEAAEYQLLKMGSVEDAAKMRPALVKLLTTSALVKDTSLPKRFRKQWAEWEKIDSLEKIQQQIQENNKEAERLLRQRVEREEKNQEQLEADHRRLKNLYFKLDVGNLQKNLSIYESQPWTLLKEEEQQRSLKDKDCRRVARHGLAILNGAFVERFDRLSYSWPELAPVRFNEVDLLTLDQDKAERTVDSMLKTPDAQRAGRKKTRQLLTLAAAYRLQQRIFSLAYTHKLAIFHEQNWPLPRDPSASEMAGQIDPVAPVSPRRDPSDAEPFLKAQASYARARQQLLQTWIDYQMIRLDLYSDLKLPPP